MMKASLSSILLLFCAIAAACHAAPFEPRASLVVPPSKIHTKSGATERALSLRGGGVFGTPVTKENLATLYTVMWGVNGALSMPAPEKVAEVFGFTLQEGTLGYLMYEIFGSSCVGLAVMAYLATNTSTSAAKIVMYGCLPCFYNTFRHVLKGTLSKVGFMDYWGVIMLAIFTACVYGIQTGSWDATLAAKVLTSGPLIMGLIGSIDPDLAGKLQGLPKQTGVTNTVCVWFYQTFLMWGILSWSLLSGESAFKSIGYASLAVALCIADNTFIRKVNQDMGLSDAVSYTYLASAAIIAAGLLLD